MWPRKTSFLVNIYVDYGRSHYYSVEKSADISRAIHQYCFRNVTGVQSTEEELQSASLLEQSKFSKKIFLTTWDFRVISFGNYAILPPPAATLF